MSELTLPRVLVVPPEEAIITNVPPTPEQLATVGRYAIEHVAASYEVPEWRDGIGISAGRVPGAAYVQHVARVDREAGQTTIIRTEIPRQGEPEKQPGLIDALKTAYKGLRDAISKPREKITEDLEGDMKMDNLSIAVLSRGGVYLVADPISKENRREPNRQIVKRIFFWPDPDTESSRE